MNSTSSSATAGRARLADIDLRLLRVFAEIVHANGFSAAQTSLGMTQATISAHMRHLEDRLGVRLCDRGRGGFLLTEEGRQVHSAMLDLFGSIERFQSAVNDAQGELTGDLTFGTVDAMASNRLLNLDRAIADFSRRAPRVRLNIDITAPQTLSQGILNGRYQVVLMPAQRQLGRMVAIEVFQERQNLYCGRGHPLFDMPEAELTDELLARQNFAGRSYMAQAPIQGIDFNWRAISAHMEGTLLLLASGAYIGFLPDHYAADSVAAGKLRALAVDRATFNDGFEIIYPRDRPVRVAELLARSILDARGRA
ncbi:MAG: LysR family transcriptional regulator [Paracoccaceae bacterium]